MDAAKVRQVRFVVGDTDLSTGDGLMVVRILAAMAANESATKSRLSRLRAEKRLTYDQLAELTGLSRTVLINLETGHTRGSLDTWHRVAHALGVPTGSLIDQLCRGHRPPG